METIFVAASKAYDVFVCDSFSPIQSYIADQKVCIVTDSNVASLYLKDIQNILPTAFSYIIKAGETSKSFCEFEKLHNFLAENNFTRRDILIALGGGVVGDLTGFTASTYMRGIDYICVPTTLLSQIDSSVGGKTAINTSYGKNLVGTFWQPLTVICNTKTLETLPEHEYSSGMAECIKYKFLTGDNLDSEINIAKCVQTKAKFVSEDEHDNNTRMLLNFGHTFGHAVEKLSNYTLSHGESVAIGMMIATKYAEKTGFAEEKISDKLCDILKKHSLPVSCNFSAKEIIAQIKKDKKVNGKIVNLILAKKLGDVRIVPTSFEELEANF